MKSYLNFIVSLETMDNPKFDLNTASLDDLKSINGIGQVRAETIINARKVSTNLPNPYLWLFLWTTSKIPMF